MSSETYFMAALMKSSLGFIIESFDEESAEREEEGEGVVDW